MLKKMLAIAGLAGLGCVNYAINGAQVGLQLEKYHLNIHCAHRPLWVSKPRGFDECFEKRENGTVVAKNDVFIWHKKNDSNGELEYCVMKKFKTQFLESRKEERKRGLFIGWAALGAFGGMAALVSYHDGHVKRVAPTLLGMLLGCCTFSNLWSGGRYFPYCRDLISCFSASSWLGYANPVDYREASRLRSDDMPGVAHGTRFLDNDEGIVHFVELTQWLKKGFEGTRYCLVCGSYDAALSTTIMPLAAETHVNSIPVIMDKAAAPAITVARGPGASVVNNNFYN